MKNEVINSFVEGLVSDLNELNTPSKVMTDALNATLITFNGNEFSLQNDMGNAKVGTAYLPQGYVPVGMKEHGGIIYVASHNPETGYGQIGCFPSPKMKYGNEENDFIQFSIDLNRILSIKKENGNEYLEIVSEFYREELFKTELESKELHVGDKFVISCNLEPFKDFINDGILKFKLASIGTDGVVSYIKNDSLKLYDNGLWILDPDVKIDNSVMQVFPGDTSGKLMIIVEYTVFDSFDLTWKYKVENSKVTGAIFTGSAIKSNDKSISKSLYDLNEYEENTTIDISASDDTIVYKIAPYSDYGISRKLIKSGEINISELQQNSEGVIDSWSYFVKEDEIEIYWGFNYLDINNEQIKHLRFVFIPIESIMNYDTDNTNNLKPDIGISKPDIKSDINEFEYKVVTKDYYIGSFEDTFAFTPKFTKNHIYVCRIDKTYDNENWECVGFEYLYTSTYFNGVTSKEIKELKNNRQTITLSKESSIKYDYTITRNTYTDSYISVNNGNINTVQTLKPLIVQDPTEDSYSFKTGIRRNGYIDVNPTISINKPFDIIGDIDISSIEFTASSHSSIDNDNRKSIDGKYEEELNSEYPDKVLGDTSQNSRTINYELNRFIYAKNGSPVTKTVSVERLLPIYEKDNDPNLFAFNYDNSNNLRCVGAEDEDMRINTIIRGVSNTADSDKGISIIESNKNISPDDAVYTSALSSMRSGSAGTIGILSGISSQSDSQDARLGFKYANTNLHVNEDFINHSEWESDSIIVQGNKVQGSMVDLGQNYMIASWKGDDNKDYLINLMSRKTDTTYRVDRLLKTILSQLLVVRRTKENIVFVAPNPNNFGYHKETESIIKIPYNIEGNSSLNIKGYNINTLYEKWDKLVENYLPNVVINIDSSITLDVNVGKGLSIDANLINLYVNSYELGDVVKPIAHPDLSENDESFNSTWRKYIYWGKVNSIFSNGVCELTKDSEGNYKLDNTYNDHGIITKYLKFNIGGKIEELKVCDLSELLSTRTSREGYLTEIPEDWYNEVLLNTNAVTSNTETPIYYFKGSSEIAFGVKDGKWLYGTPQTNAPDLANFIHFGKLSRYEF